MKALLVALALAGTFARPVARGPCTPIASLKVLGQVCLSRPHPTEPGQLWVLCNSKGITAEAHVNGRCVVDVWPAGGGP